jgi:hypothetical protein
MFPGAIVESMMALAFGENGIAFGFLSLVCLNRAKLFDKSTFSHLSPRISDFLIPVWMANKTMAESHEGQAAINESSSPLVRHLFL